MPTATAEFMKRLAIPAADEQKLVYFYRTFTRGEGRMVDWEFLEIVRDEFYTAGAINLRNSFGEYIARETHYAVEKKGFKGEQKDWTANGMNPHEYERIRDDVLARFVRSSLRVLEERARRGSEDVSMIVSLNPEEIKKRSEGEG